MSSTEFKNKDGTEFENTDGTQFQLREINFDIEKEKLIIITGPNNSGKVNSKINMF